MSQRRLHSPKVWLGIGVLLALLGAAQEALGQVLRPEDPQRFLFSPDASTLRANLGQILDRMSGASNGLVVFRSQDDFTAFLKDMEDDVNQVISGRTDTTRGLGRATLGAITQITQSTAAAASPSVNTVLLEELAKKTSDLLASVVSEGQKGGFAPSPQAPSKVMPSPQIGRVSPTTSPGGLISLASSKSGSSG